MVFLDCSFQIGPEDKGNVISCADFITDVRAGSAGAALGIGVVLRWAVHTLVRHEERLDTGNEFTWGTHRAKAGVLLMLLIVTAEADLRRY